VFCGVLRCFVVFVVFCWCSAVFCGVLRCFAVFCGFLLVALAISFRCGIKYGGAQTPALFFWSVENNRAKMGGSGPLSHLKTLFLDSS
jgi:hypothetical protein